jgi:dipeptidyl aminopeptidase/acylaminoacyl peptidase
MRTILTFLAIVMSSATGGAQSPAAGALTIETLVQIRHPFRGTWSPDSKLVAFALDHSGVQNVYVVDPARGLSSLRAATGFPDGLLEGPWWTPEGSRLLFGREGDLWQVPATGGEAQRVWQTPQIESGFVPSPDGTRVAFLRDGDVWVRAFDGGGERALTRTPALEGGAVWSPDGTRVAFTVVAAERQMESPDYSGAKILYSWFERQPSDVGVVAAAGGGVTLIGATPATESAPRWIDNSRLCLQRLSEDFTTREILVADVSSGNATSVHRDVDAKFWSLTYLNPEPVPSPDGRWIAFISDRDGWDHLYVVPAGGGDVRQVTRGRFEVSRIAWAPDSRRVAFDTNEGDRPGVRHVAILSVGAGVGHSADEPITRLTTGRGTNTEPYWSPDGRRLLYLHTDPRSPADLFSVDASANATPTRLSDSLPTSVDRSKLVEPQFVTYPSKDGKPVPAYLFVPPGLDRGRRHPAIVWVHGDGVTQNYDGWHVRRDYAVYYSFHQYLAQRGYVVLAVDYRGSIGYGRDWRQGHFRDLGGRDYEDVAAGVDYLKTRAEVDLTRVGVWGLSYGGFMTLQALTVTPELFACGIDVAGVVDWRDWHKDPDGPWIKGRMGSPSQNAELYRRTAPIERIDRLVRPLMVLHGTADVNVPYLESVRLIDTALKLDKHVEFMMYPGEFHYFHRAHVLRDAWTRVARFFDEHLRPGAHSRKPGT